jgi:hypothetical protein
LPQQQAAKSQRTRWEHGHLQRLLTQTPRLATASVGQKRFDLMAIALDLSVPPLSLLVAIWLAAFAASILATIIGTSPIPAILLAVQGLLNLVQLSGLGQNSGVPTFPVQLFYLFLFTSFGKFLCIWVLS